MIASIHVPLHLAGQPLEPCAVPETLIEASAAHGIGAGQCKFEVSTNAGLIYVGLADEFDGMVGYEFDWGWVLPYLPAWFEADSDVASVAWRVVPVALWGELAARGRLLEPVPTVLGHSARRSVPFVSHCLEAPVAELSRALPHDAFTLFPDPDDSTGELVDWLEGVFLPRELPRLLRLLHSLALKRAHEMERGSPAS